jgi:succinate--hydroxymethylglutarate CoA-transferase
MGFEGYGSGGPSAKRAGYDAIVGAEAGLLHITGEKDGKPTKPGLGLTDMCTGLYLHGAILAALIGRQSTNVGQKIDASLFETQISLLANVGMSWLNLGLEAQRWGTAHPSIVPYEAFQTKDSFLFIGAVNNRQFTKLCTLLGNTKLSTEDTFKDNDCRVRNRAVLKPILDDLFMQKLTEEWLDIFEGSGMPYGAINNMEQVFSHPQTLARNMVETLDYENTKSGKLKVIGQSHNLISTSLFSCGLSFNLYNSTAGVPVKFSEQQPSIRLAPPTLGQHTDDVLKEIGISREEVAQLRAQGVV